MLVPLDMQKLLEYCCGMVLTQIQGITGTTRHYMKQLWKAKWMFVWVGNFSLGLYEAKFNLDLVKVKPMLVSGVCRSCTPIWHIGFGWDSDDAYSLWEVMLFRAPNSVFVWQFAPSFFPASWLALASIEVGKYLHWVCQCDGATLWVAMDTSTPFLRLAFQLAPPPAFMGSFLKLIYWWWVE